MTRPTFEVADILRTQGDRFLDRYRSSFGFQQLKAFRAIQRCRTATLGGHRDACPCRRAAGVLADRIHFAVPEAEFRRFTDVLDSPPVSNVRLTALLSAKAP